MLGKIVLFLFLFTCGCYQSSPTFERPEISGPDAWCAETYLDNIKWQQLQFPIEVYIEPMVNEQDVEATILALTAWNTTMHAPIFVPIVSDRPVDERDCGSVFVRADEPPKGNWGYTWWTACTAVIKLKDGLDRDTATRVMVHELGHSLNLGHEDNEMSIMHATLTNVEQSISDLSMCLIDLALEDASGERMI